MKLVQRNTRICLPGDHCGISTAASFCHVKHFFPPSCSQQRETAQSFTPAQGTLQHYITVGRLVSAGCDGEAGRAWAGWTATALPLPPRWEEADRSREGSSAAGGSGQAWPGAKSQAAPGQASPRLLPTPRGTSSSPQDGGPAPGRPPPPGPTRALTHPGTHGSPRRRCCRAAPPGRFRFRQEEPPGRARLGGAPYWMGGSGTSPADHRGARARAPPAGREDRAAESQGTGRATLPPCSRIRTLLRAAAAGTQALPLARGPGTQTHTTSCKAPCTGILQFQKSALFPPQKPALPHWCASYSKKTPNQPKTQLLMTSPGHAQAPVQWAPSQMFLYIWISLHKAKPLFVNQSLFWSTINQKKYFWCRCPLLNVCASRSPRSHTDPTAFFSSYQLLSAASHVLPRGLLARGVCVPK